MTDVYKIMHPQHFGTNPTNIRIRIESGLIRKSGFEPQVTFVSNFGVVRGLRFLSALVTGCISSWLYTFYGKSYVTLLRRRNRRRSVVLVACVCLFVRLREIVTATVNQSINQFITRHSTEARATMLQQLSSWIFLNRSAIVVRSFNWISRQIVPNTYHQCNAAKYCWVTSPSECR